MNKNNYYRHSDILAYIRKLSRRLNELAGLLLPFYELQETKSWRYCKTQFG